MINWWQIWTIVLACAYVCLFVATGLALMLMYRYKAKMEKAKEAHEAELEKLRDYIDGLKEDLSKSDDACIQYGKDAIAQAKRVDAALQERDALEVANSELGLEKDVLTAERDSLQGYLDRANEGRLKAQAQLEEVLVARTRVPRPRTKKSDTASLLTQQ